MWLLVYAPAILGVLRYRRWSYWRWVVAMLLWQAAAQFLFASGGTLDHPTGDGLISRAIRQATDDGPAFAAYGVAFLVLFYGGVVYFVRQLYRDAHAGREEAASGPRKSLEIVALTAVTGVLLYTSLPFLHEGDASNSADGPQTVEAALDAAVAEAKPGLPLKLDDVTTWTDVSRERQTMVFDYAINAENVSRDAAAEYIRSDVVDAACAHPANQAILRTGASIRFRYRLASGGEPLSHDLTADLCSEAATRNPAPQKNSSISR
ncbi:hypothetical protein GGQ61_001855 [Phenylobacterium haematophilum]|jgi:hypothetical protein|uniref:Uncharacterized protein n=1 Tax=Phenylobacterium haematophilum TaxID=98513 RepID=A0A839ZYD5_9CAUL|nr:hypothetical protein [Phenylobacterium haematophilum]MBB3891138.1 hypothetical protein [Phenylobacterium haematophilum]